MRPGVIALDLTISAPGDGVCSAPGTVRLKNCLIDTEAPSAVTLIRLASENGTDENTIDNPRAVYPESTEIKSVQDGCTINFEVAPFSVNILKVKLKAD